VKLGLDSYSYRRAAGLWDYTLRENQPMGIAHFLEKAADLSLDGVHLSDARHLDSFEYGYISALKSQADDVGLYLELGTSGTNPDHLETLVRSAHVLGSRVVNTYLNLPRVAPAQRMERMLSELAGQL
jgi:sugar phosphate isomerase/epimerase